MTIDNLFGPERKPLRLKVIKPIYEILKITEAASQYLNKRHPSPRRFLWPTCSASCRHETKEHFIALHLDSKNRLLCLEIVSVGSLNASIVHPREVYKSALLSSAAAIVFVHNHPSGDPTPSREDIELTSRLKEASELLGIRLLDHVVIGTGRHYSFADTGLTLKEDTMIRTQIAYNKSWITRTPYPTLAYHPRSIQFMGDGYSPEEHGHIIVIQEGDDITQYQGDGEDGLFIDDIPTFEFVEAFVDGDQVAFELVFQLDDSRTVAVIIPDEPWLDPSIRNLLMSASPPPMPLPKIQEVVP